MIEAEVHTRIAEALAGRRNQQAFVDELSGAWTAMADVLDRLLLSLQGAERSVRANPALPNQRVLLTAVETARHGDGLRERIATAGRQVDAACARVRRDTVNIGVIGGTKVGKSSLLRTITSLPESVIPTTRFNPTTATASRIYHTTGQPLATLELHTWESFRDQYLAPLHDLAHVGPAPADPTAFRRFRYPAPGSAEAGHAEVDDYLRKLLSAQRSFPSYIDLLQGSSRTIAVEFGSLRPFVAYPDLDAGDPVDVQPFHAVVSVRIDQTFLEGAATKLGLIDLPGAGEAGLDIDRQFLRRVKNEIDLLVMVKRGDRKAATYLAEDSYTRKLADSARAGVPLEDYYMVLVNRDKANDPTGDFFANTVKSVTEISGERDIRVLTADVIDREDVFAGLVHPALSHLASRLAEMDRAAVREALTTATSVAGEVIDLARDVLGRDLAHLLPDQEDELRNLAEELRDGLADDLALLVDRYDDQLAAGEADAALAGAITDAVAKARAWVRDGLGRGTRDQWMSEIRPRYVARSLEAKQDEYYRAKSEIAAIFSQIDVSLEDSVQRLWEDVAQVLRGRLTEELVPTGPAALDALRVTAERRRALILRDALRQLCQLKVDYGSVVLRVTQPVIRGIHWDRAAAFHTPAVPAPRTAARAQVTPAKPAPAQQPVTTVVSGWVRMPDGTMQRGGPLPTPPRPTPPKATTTPPTPLPTPAKAMPTPTPGGEQESAKRGAEGLYDELTATVDACVTDLETALRDEARMMARTLAAAADMFFNSAIRTNRSERDYENLCKPNQRAIWPSDFDGASARVGAELSRVQEQAQLALAAGDKVAQLSQGLRLRPTFEA